jgi:enoyl-CoA hydratase/carnithine racemase
MASKRTDLVYVETSGQIAELILNRPDSRNAISREMWLAIPQLLRELRMHPGSADVPSSSANTDPAIVVIRGVGNSFAAGADISELQDIENLDDSRQNWDAIASALDAVYHFELPTIAAIDGPCMGGGCLLASSCDLRYASARSCFSVPIAKLGIVLDDANLGRLAALVGVSRAKEMIFRARRLTASEALDWGLVNDVFAPESFQEKFNKVLQEIMDNSAVSLKEAKASFARFTAFASDPANKDKVVGSYLLPDSQERIQKALKKD